MTEYRRNDGGIEKARSMIESHQYVLDSDWSESQPSPAEENEKIDRDGYEGFGEWHLAIEAGASAQSKDRYGFIFGDFERVHRSGLIAAKQRAAEWGHGEIERVADELLSLLDARSA